jgi:probable F420-dependent oxidoreductase
MQIGVVYPQSDLLTDPDSLRAYGQGVESLGFRHLLTYDHVLGADRSVHDDFAGPYDIDTTFHEPFVLFAFLAACTDLEFVTGILIAPQRQTALIAKQAAEVDVLSGGKLRVGVGNGWNKVEYDALGKEFTNRGKRLEEQVALLRRLWTEHSVTFEGEYETVIGAGLAPMPVQQPIPIWMGASSTAAFERIGRVADGWFPMMRPGDDLAGALATIAESASAAGRDATKIGMEGRVGWQPDDPDKFRRQVDRWQEVGATHLGVDTMRLGLSSPAEHLAALEGAAKLLDLG